MSYLNSLFQESVTPGYSEMQERYLYIEGESRGGDGNMNLVWWDLGMSEIQPRDTFSAWWSRYKGMCKVDYEALSYAKNLWLCAILVDARKFPFAMGL